MNNRFKLALTLLTSRRNKGFAMAICFMIGAIMLLTGVVIMTRSTKDKDKVLSQKKAVSALAVTETGISKYMNFLNSNRVLLEYPSCEGTPNASTGVCPDTGTAESWANVINNDTILPPPPPDPYPDSTACPNETSSDSGSSGATPTDISVTWANKNGNTWILTEGGEFRLIGYQYYPNGSKDGHIGTGRMILEGQTIDGNKSAADDMSGKARIAVDFPISLEGTTEVELPIPDGAPGLWARDFDINVGGHTVYANVLDSSGCDTGNTSFSNPVGNLPTIPLGSFPNGNHTPPLSSTTSSITQEVRAFPPLPKYPTASEFTTLVNANKVNQLSSCSGKTAYPADGDYDSTGTAYDASVTSVAERTYIYRITGDCTLPANTTFGVSGKDNIIMYIDSTLDIGNHARIAQDAGSRNTKVLWLLRTANLDLGGNSQVGSAAPDGSTASKWAFFLYEGTSVSMRGTSDYYAFIFAPNATADLRGNPKIGGALWVDKFWTKGKPPKVFQAINQEQLEELFETLYSLEPELMSDPKEPKLSSISSWSRLEVPDDDKTFADFPPPKPVEEVANNTSDTTDNTSDTTDNTSDTTDNTSDTTDNASDTTDNASDTTDNTSDNSNLEATEFTKIEEPEPVCIKFHPKKGHCQKWG